jgi:succinate dehydrogenase hydrophobic anchor subunit
MAAKHRTLSLGKRGFDFDTFMWLFVRLSALAMYLFLFIGLVGALIMGARTQVNFADLLRWTFMPDSNHVLMNTTLNNITNADAWTSLFWKVLGSIFVTFAASHGLHGLLSVVEDYLKNAGVRRILRYTVLAITIIGIAIAIFVIWKR